jgi:hypothetical protein
MESQSIFSFQLVERSRHELPDSRSRCTLTRIADKRARQFRDPSHLISSTLRRIAERTCASLRNSKER